MEENCCNENSSCKEEATPNALLRHIRSALWNARQLRDQRGIGGREAALVVTELEYAEFRAEQYQRELEGTFETVPDPAAPESCRENAVGC